MWAGNIKHLHYVAMQLVNSPDCKGPFTLKRMRKIITLGSLSERLMCNRNTDSQSKSSWSQQHFLMVWSCSDLSVLTTAVYYQTLIILGCKVHIKKVILPETCCQTIFGADGVSGLFCPCRCPLWWSPGYHLMLTHKKVWKKLVFKRQQLFYKSVSFS